MGMSLAASTGSSFEHVLGRGAVGNVVWGFLMNFKDTLGMSFALDFGTCWECLGR